MVLLKAFFRKKKTKIYIKIFTIVITVLFLLNSINNYVAYESDKLKFDSTPLIIFAKGNHENIIKKEKGVKSYRRALSFNIGLDNDIIYSPSIEINNNSVEYTEDLDETKIEWRSLQFHKNILAFPSDTCNDNIEDNEVILFLSELNYNSEYFNNYLNENITFKYNNQEISLLIKDIIEPSTFNHICISDNLYNSLLAQEETYIYDIEATDYKTQQKLKEKWHNIEDNEFFNISTPVCYKSMDLNERTDLLDNLVKILDIITIISLIIFFVIIIFITKDLVSDEEKDILILKQLGYNKKQITLNSLKNISIFSILILLLSLIVSILIITAINIIFKLGLKLFNMKFFLIITIFIFVINTLLNLLQIRNSNI